jgi:cystathionine beta-lyase
LTRSMSNGQQPDGMHWRTRLIHSEAHAPEGFHALTTGIHRGSTVVFERLADAIDDWRASSGYTYGLYGTPTTLELGLRIAEIERAKHSFVVPGGQAAITLIYLAYCKSGSHVLIPESAYGPNRDLARGLLKGFGVEVERYDPMAGERISELIRDNTTLIWCESPGSITMEVQDVPAIVAAAHARGVAVALDNTYAAGVLFDAFAANVDVSMQALTKYVGGHSDLLLGTVSVASDDAYERVGRMHRLIGMGVSPDECALALRGLKTLGVRLERLEKTALTVAGWLSRQADVSLVLHPAFPDCPGHDIWKRDFAGSASIFSIVLQPDWDRARIVRFVESLRLFKIGFSWGGVTSLVMAYPHLYRRERHYDNRVVRLNVGLEEADDLIADLEQAFRAATP